MATRCAAVVVARRVSIGPGQTQFAVMPCAPTSMATDRVSAISPALDEA